MVATKRAAALPPSERRAEIVAATLPLLLVHGASVTTRQIAEAAGIAEGTIFRVFPDKESLIAAVVESAFDTKTVDAALAAIDPTLPLEPRLVAAVEILRRRFADILQLSTAVEMMQLSATLEGDRRTSPVARPPRVGRTVRSRPRPLPAHAARSRAPPARPDHRRHPPVAHPRRAADVGRDRLVVPRRRARSRDARRDREGV